MKRTCYICDYIDHPDRDYNSDVRQFYFDGKGWVCSDCISVIKDALADFEEENDDAMEEDTSTLPEMYE